MKLAEIAAEINKHLQGFARDVPNGKNGTTLYWHPSARAAGSKVMVCYVSYQGFSGLAKDEALSYLAWLKEGNIGRHYEWRRL